MAEIIFEDIEKRYPDGHAAIHGLNLTIRDGEFLVLVGPSGCGKSTALRMIAGLEDISGGRLLIDGVVANDLAPRDRDIAMVFQSYALYPHLTVGENIGFGLRVRGADRGEIARKVRETAKLLELEDHLDRKPGQLSGGQRQRVAMGRALVRHPRAFLMDEPLSNLDARLRGQMRAEISRLQKLSGVTTVYVTHDQVEAMTMGDRVAVMKQGILQQLAPPRTLYDAPANIYVAGFIGAPTMNLMEAELASGNDGVLARIGAAALVFGSSELAIRPGLARAVGRPAVVGIRPEALALADPDNPPAGAFRGRIAFVEDLGATLLVHVDLDGGSAIHTIATEPDDVVTAFPRLRALVDGTNRLAAGDRVALTADPARVHVFDAATEAAITG